MCKNFINISYLSAPATLESTRILLCNIDYEVKVENENIKNIQTIFNSINYNLNNDNFPKPGSGNKIYNGMSEVEQNIKYKGHINEELSFRQLLSSQYLQYTDRSQNDENNFRNQPEIISAFKEICHV